MGRAVAVVAVGVVVAALGAEEQGGQYEQAAAEDQHGGQGEAGGVHGGQRARGVGTQSAGRRRYRRAGQRLCGESVAKALDRPARRLLLIEANPG